MNLNEWKKAVQEERFLKSLEPMYGNTAGQNRPRYAGLLDLYEKTFQADGEDQVFLFSAPGRTEIGGNHTDHQHGRVLAAAVNMDTIAAAGLTKDNIIRVKSEGFDMCEIDAGNLDVVGGEKNTTASLIRGVAAGFAARGCSVGGFQAVVSSTVLPGSGLSSSAAFEVLIGNIINSLFFDNGADAVAIARIGQFAENVYFGKPSGLMDQMASSVGNILTIDFEDEEKPLVRKLDVDFEASNLALCIIDSGASHADLTDEYAAIPNELKGLCALFGKRYLREIPEEVFIEKIPEIRKKTGDRALLRAMHFYDDNGRVPLQAKALEEKDISGFLRMIRESGISSWVRLQNITPPGATTHQEMAFLLAAAGKLLGERGACRVHGGGFAGTCQAFVPLDMLDDFTTEMDRLLGEGSCHVLSIRQAGGTQIVL